MSDRLTLARTHWTPLPDWVEALARASDDTSQNQVARRLGYSAPVVSLLLRRAYKGDLARIEELVRAELMQERRNCPALGEIRLAECLHHQDQAKNPGSPNPLRANMRRACHACPIFNKEGTT